MRIRKELSKIEFEMREHAFRHSPMEKEMRFYDCVRQGDLEGARAYAAPLGGEGFGVLSEDELRNLKYHLVVTAALITRFCVEGGMERETAYNLSDIYIRAADGAASAGEVHHIHAELIADFTERMRERSKRPAVSYQVTKCMEYVYDHLHEKISVGGIAGELGISAQYLSKLFCAETGMTLSRYILKKKIDAACRLLKYSDYEAAAVGSFLAFGSHSYFIQKFREETGLTPKQYREKYRGFRAGFGSGEHENAENKN